VPKKVTGIVRGSGTGWARVVKGATPVLVIVTPAQSTELLVQEEIDVA